MPISMSEKAHYTTQSGVYSSLVTGRLTDRRIKHYQKLGYYGGTFIRARAKQADRKRVTRKATYKEIFAKFVL